MGNSAFACIWQFRINSIEYFIFNCNLCALCVFICHIPFGKQDFKICLENFRDTKL